MKRFVSLRLKLIVPIVALMMGSTLLLAFFVFRTQNSMLASMNIELEQSLTSMNTQVQDALSSLQGDVSQNLEKMSNETSKQFSDSLQKSLHDEEKTISANLENELKQQALSITALIAEIAPNYIISKDYANLAKLLTAGAKNENLVFMLIQGADGTPLARQMERSNPMIQAFNKSGQGNDLASRVLQAAKISSDVLLFEEPIVAGDSKLGTLIVCMTRTTILEKVKGLKQRFLAMEETSVRLVKDVSTSSSQALSTTISLKIQKTEDDNKISSRAVIDKLSQDFLTSMRDSQWAIAIPALLGVLIAAVALFFIVRVFVDRPLQQACNVIQAIAAGNLNSRIKLTQNDEIGTLARSLNLMAEKFFALVQEIKLSSNLQATAATALSSTATQLASNAEELNAQAHTVASTSEQLSANVKNIAQGADKIAESVNETSHEVFEIGQGIQHISKTCIEESAIAETAQNKAIQNKVTIDELSEAALEIGKIVELIDAIARKTNLLALNATIEAASAGEAGKGFAVVASEVKDLARQSAESTHQIAEHIKRIQNTSERTVEVNREVQDFIAQMNNLAKEIALAVEKQSVSTSVISERMNRVSDSVKDLASNVAEASTGVTEIATNISGVSQAANDTSKAAGSIKHNADELVSISKEMTSAVGEIYKQDSTISKNCERSQVCNFPACHSHSDNLRASSLVQTYCHGTEHPHCKRKVLLKQTGQQPQTSIGPDGKQLA